MKALRSLRQAALVLALAALAACAVNPVTGKREISLVSEAQEIEIGKSGYAPAQQSQGGDWELDPDLTDYVRSVGRKLAAVSDRPQLPWEFVVLNDSTPNAWAMPGGKLAVNRGLLLLLDDEAELAAVLGHEIVHAAARHGAKEVERGLLYQVGMLGLSVALADQGYGEIVAGGAAVAVGLVNSKYSRAQELEADEYGMKYMAKAGYDPEAAVRVQEKLVLLAQRQGGQGSGLEGLFSTHPPSEERVEANRKTAADLPKGDFVGRREYQARTARLRQAAPAYEALDEGREALAHGDSRRAASLAEKAIRLEPREAMFHGLRGDALAKDRRWRAALDAYDEAIDRNGRFFQFYVQRGLVEQELGQERDAENDLERSVGLLPTTIAHYALGTMQLERGDPQGAIGNFRAAAGGGGELGHKAAVALAKLEIEDKPGAYVSASPSVDGNGFVSLHLSNQSPVAVRDVVVQLSIYKPKDWSPTTRSVRIYGRIEAGGSRYESTNVRVRTGKKQPRVEAEVVRAELAE